MKFKEKMNKMIKKILILVLLVLFTGDINAKAKSYKMVFVPASEKGDESDYETLISITEIGISTFLMK